MLFYKIRSKYFSNYKILLQTWFKSVIYSLKHIKFRSHKKSVEAPTQILRNFVIKAVVEPDTAITHYVIATKLTLKWFLKIPQEYHWLGHLLSHLLSHL